MIRNMGKKLLPVIIALIFVGCVTSSAEKKSGELKGYDLNKPERFVMPNSLIEISGIAFNHHAGDVVYAIQDEEGKFFKLNWGVKKQTHAKFAKSGDYEDVAILHDKVIVLKSNGTLYTFNLSDATDDEDVDHVEEWKKLLPPGEYEGMCADETTSQLYILCKNCDQDKDSKGVSGFVFRMDDSITRTGNFFIDAATGSGMALSVKKGLRPSAIAKNPVTHEWFVLSSVNKLLLIVDEQWKVKQAVHLSANTFNQPEGIAFDNAGNLYISNEGDDVTEGNILKFTRTQK